MRKIKFRLFKNEKIVGYEYHMKCIGGIQVEYSYDNTWGNPIGYIVHNFKEQYTGFNDKHNNEIYEGDKVENHGVHGESDIGIIIFKDGEFQFERMINKATYSIGCYANRHIKIIKGKQWIKK